MEREFEGRVALAYRLTSLLHIGVALPVHAGLMTKTGDGAVITDTDNHYGYFAGALLLRLGTLFERVTGIDNAPSMLDRARAAVAGNGGSIVLKQQDFMTLPAQRRYDLLVAAMVVHHQASPASFFSHASTANRWTKPRPLSVRSSRRRCWLWVPCSLGSSPVNQRTMAPLSLRKKNTSSGMRMR